MILRVTLPHCLAKRSGQAKKNIIILIIAIAVASFSIYYATAGIFKTNTQVVNDLTSGLVGYWTFDGQDTDWGANTTNDLSGNNNTGTMNNMSTTTSPVPGVIGQALDFAGNDVSMTGLDMDIFSTNQTVCLWAYVNSLASDQILYQYSDTALDQNIFWRLYTSGIMNIADGSSDVLSDTNATLSTNTWYHLCHVATDFTNDNTVNDTMKFYINGSLDETETRTHNPAPEGDVLRIGSRISGGAPFNGTIDEVRIYDRALSASEIMELYNQGAKRLIKTNVNQKTEIVGDGLVGYWTFDGQDTDWGTNTTNDLSGNGNTGTMTNMSTTTSPAIGVVGQALEFNNIVGPASEYVTVPNNASLNMTQAITVSFWMKPDNSSAYFGPLMKTSDGWVSINGYGFYYLGGCFKFWINYGATYACAGYPSLGKWHHVVGTYDRSNIRIYVDGVEGTPLPYDAAIVSNNEELYIGATSPIFGFGFDGKVDEVRIYDRVLSTNEITELYNQGAEKLLKVNMPQTDLIPNGLVGYWTFDGQDTDWGTNTTNDVSGNSNTGTMIDMSTSTSPAAGIIGQALDFDGSDDYIVVDDSASLNMTNALTVSMWIKPETAIPKYTTPLGKSDSQVTDGYGFLIQGGLKFFVNHIDDGNAIFSPKPAPGEWYHIVGTYDSSDVRIYVDGVEGTPQSYSTPIGTVNYDLFLGTDGGGNRFFDGLIDEVRIYNRALSASEVKELYVAGVGR